ncbi:MAG: aminotransferase class V-fold PLP-dependent enzyme [Alphaproteobacteria bacterium]|nr:MAG: aminotransferase class V-fold PLP-dependent enzyme [Alphaproteobacteria bacterium]
MDVPAFRKQGHRLIDWIADYMEAVENHPVRARVRPGEISARLPQSAPEAGEPWDEILADLDDIIMPGITHWQHPMFMAYFPSVSSPPAVLAEMVIAGLGVQGMMWETSPAATELETRVMDWLRQAMGLADGFHGVIQDSASSSTLCAVLSARERATAGEGNAQGGKAFANLTIYSSTEAHSSVDKAVRIAGIGDSHFRKLPVDGEGALDCAALEAAIIDDKAAGLVPAQVVATLGTTGTGAVDDVATIGVIARRHGLWLHVDAAWAGSALLLPEHRSMGRGLDVADSFVMNPHKWLYTGMDCSAYFVRDPQALQRTFAILPEYLKTAQADVINYRDWGIALGRRFRAVKLWFVLRSYGLDGLRSELRRHVALARDLAQRLAAEDDFQILVPPRLALFVFRYRPEGVTEGELDSLNERLLAALNDSGHIYLTRVRVDGRVAIRVSVGQTGVEARHMERAFHLITERARRL